MSDYLETQYLLTKWTKRITFFFKLIDVEQSKCCLKINFKTLLSNESKRQKFIRYKRVLVILTNISLKVPLVT